MALTFQTERLSECLEEAKPLLAKHWQEIALNKDIIPLAPDYQRYFSLERDQKLCVCTARDEGKIVGYAVYVYDRQLHYPVLWAESDIFYVDPSLRRPRVAHRLIGFMEEELKHRGVRVMHSRAKVAHPAAGRVLEIRWGTNPLKLSTPKFFEELLWVLRSRRSLPPFKRHWNM